MSRISPLIAFSLLAPAIVLAGGPDDGPNLLVRGVTIGVPLLIIAAAIYLVQKRRRSGSAPKVR